MPELPAIAHVTLTVATLIAVSGGTNDSSMLHFIGTRALARFDVPSGLSEVRLSSGFTSSPIHLTLFRSMSVELAWTIWPSPVVAEMSLRRGRIGCHNSVSTTVGSSMLAMALDSLAVTRTTSLWNSSVPPFRRNIAVPGRA